MAALLGNIFSGKKSAAKVVRRSNSVKKEKGEEAVVAKGAENNEQPAVKSRAIKKKDAGAYKVLLRPLITEKATDAGMFNKYEFVVAQTASRTEVKELVKKIYGVAPTKVNIIRSLGKDVRQGRKHGKTKDWKKAIVTLAQGDKIEIYEGV